MLSSETQTRCPLLEASTTEALSTGRSIMSTFPFYDKTCSSENMKMNSLYHFYTFKRKMSKFGVRLEEAVLSERLA